jgi:hypothetical protein
MDANVSDNDVPPERSTAGSQTLGAGSFAERPVRLARTMRIAGLCALVPLAGNAINTLLTGWTGRASWLLVPAVSVCGAMIEAAIQADGSDADSQGPARDGTEDPQRSAQRRPARGETSLKFALIVVVLVFGLGGLAVSEGTRYVVIEAHATISDGVSAISDQISRLVNPVEPGLVLRPRTVRAGNWISVSGRRFQPRERVVITLEGYELGATRANARGRFRNKRFQIPSNSDFAFAGQFRIRAEGDASHRHVVRPIKLHCGEGYQRVLGSCLRGSMPERPAGLP